MSTFLCDPHDYATQTRLDRLWALEHRWLALSYRIMGLGIMTAAGIGAVAVAWKLVEWVLAWR
jgi:hypothetical protein